MNCSEPCKMTFNEMQEEIMSLRESAAVKDKALLDKDVQIQQAKRESQTKDLQIVALTHTNNLASDILKSSVATASPSKQMWLQKKVTEISKNIKDLICEASTISIDNISQVLQKLYHAVISICNFIYDNIGDIVVFTALLAAGAILAFDVVLLGACLLNGTVISAEAITAGAAAGTLTVIDFAYINSLV